MLILNKLGLVERPNPKQIEVWWGVLKRGWVEHPNPKQARLGGAS